MGIEGLYIHVYLHLIKCDDKDSSHSMSLYMKIQITAIIIQCKFKFFKCSYYACSKSITKTPKMQSKSKGSLTKWIECMVLNYHLMFLH